MENEKLGFCLGWTKSGDKIRRVLRLDGTMTGGGSKEIRPLAAALSVCESFRLLRALTGSSGIEPW